MNSMAFPPELMPSLPWSPESEAGVIGALLMENKAWDNVADILTAHAFHDERAGRIFAVIGQLINAGKPADVITVFERLGTIGLDAGLALVDIHNYTNTVASARNARYYAKTVAEKWLSRRLLTAADDVYGIASDMLIPIGERVDQAQARLEALRDRTDKSQPESIQSLFAGAIAQVQALADGSVQPGIQTRIPAIDKMLGGLKPGQQIILAARPSVGKSSLAEQICINLAMDGHPAAMLSMEMTKAQLTKRAICNVGRIDMGRYNTGQLEDAEWSRMTEAIEKMRDVPLYFDEQPSLTLQDIASKARILKRKYGIKLLALDYIQLCGTTNFKLGRHHQLEELSRGIKALAKTLDITIITLSQLNREVEKRVSGRPVLSDLKESGAIEEDADVVMLMWRHSKSESHQVNGLEVAKNRDGRCGDIALHFEGRYQRWAESTESLYVPSKNHEFSRSNKFTDEI